MRGVKNGPCPEWLQRQLTAIGLRPINALVDITNFITYDRGRPLHVFDAAKVQGNLVVRRAQRRRDTACARRQDLHARRQHLHHRRRRRRGIAAGIMGGEATGCSEATTDVLIESALWERLNIAQTGRKLGINSDARYRFERGVDPAFLVPGLELATKLVLDLCGGTAVGDHGCGRPAGSGVADRFPSRRDQAADRHPTIPFPEMRRVLDGLGFLIAGQGKVVKIAAPSWRPDVHGKADIVEEIVRIVGVDRVPSTPFERGDKARKPILTPMQCAPARPSVRSRRAASSRR